MTRKSLIAVAAIVALLSLAALGWFFGPAYWPRSTVADTLLVSGNIEAHESIVSFKAVQSRIITLPFNEGQWVTAGTLLAKLDDADYREQVAVAQAALDVQRGQLALAQRQMAAARATVADDRADLAQKQVDWDRNRKLYADGVIAAQTRDLAATAVAQSAAACQRDQANLGAAVATIAVAQANIENAQHQLELARINLGYTTLQAPFSGVILVRQAELGEVMQPGTPVVTLADLDHVWLRAYISETDLTRVRRGQPATITTDNYHATAFPGRISFISSQAEFTPKSVETHKERVTLVYRIKIDIDNPQHLLKPGMPADALIHLNPPTRQAVLTHARQPVLTHE